MGKVCSKCKIEKDITLFYKRIDSQDGYRNDCISCNSLIKKERRIKDKNDPEKLKRKNEKSREYKRNNKDKISKLGKDYYLKNKDEINRKHNEYYEKNKLKRNEVIKAYTKNNKEKINLRNKLRMMNNPLIKLICNIRCLIGNSLRERGYSKKSKTQKILGCSYIEFKEHIESQFKDGISWENRNEWHIDHIIPLDFAVNEEEILKLNHYTNLRPLWIKDNISKFNKIVIETDLYYDIIENRN